MSTQNRLEQHWDRLHARIVAVLACPRSDVRSATLARLYMQEFRFWQLVFERATRRTAWLSALSAGEHARLLAYAYAAAIGGDDAVRPASATSDKVVAA